jgi:hypothetical protein
LATLATVCDGAFPAAPKLKRWHTYTPCATGLLHRSTPHRTPDSWDQSPSPVPTTMPTKRRELLCPLEVLPLEGWHECHLEGHYPFFVAHTSSCANPKSSTRLRLRYSSWSLQVAASPCWMRDLPDVISASLSLDAWTRIPLACRSAHARYFLPQHRPSPPGTRVGMPEWSAQRLLSGPVFRDDSHSLDVQASKFACHPGRSHRCGSKTARQPWRLHPSRTYVVTFIRIGHASRPNRAIDDRGLSPH